MDSSRRITASGSYIYAARGADRGDYTMLQGEAVSRERHHTGRRHSRRHLGPGALMLIHAPRCCRIKNGLLTMAAAFRR